MESNEAYPEIITQTIDTFIDRIEQVLLARGTARAERTSICSEVETQIHLMIERKIESGSVLSLELVKGIVESMDPPESYATTAETTAVESPSPVTAQAKNTSERRFGFASLKTFLNPPKRTSPSIDWVAIGGVGAICMGIVLFQMALLSGRRGGEVFAVGSFFLIFAGSIASIVSFWRIRHSNGLLTGQKIASAGMIAVPFFMINALLCAFLFATPIGYVVGAGLILASLVYGNYWAARRTIAWLGAYSVKVTEADAKPADDRKTPAEVSGAILEVGA